MSSSRSRAYVNVVDRSRISDTLQRRERPKSWGCQSALTHTYLANCASHCACVSTRPLPAGLYRSVRWGRSAHVCACVPIANVSVIATTSAVRISASPRVSTVESSLDGKPARSRRTRRASPLHCQDLRRRSARTGKQQSCLKNPGAQKMCSPFSLESGLLRCRRVRVIRELMTVHNGGCHESVRSRASDVRYSSGVFSY